MDHGRKEGCEEVRKEGGKEGNNTHGAWKEGGERIGKKKEGTYQRQEGKSMKERKELRRKEERKGGAWNMEGREEGRKEIPSPLKHFLPTMNFSFYLYFLPLLISYFLEVPSFNPSLIYSTQKPCFHVSILSSFICSFLYSFTSSYTLHSLILSFSILSPLNLPFLL